MGTPGHLKLAGVPRSPIHIQEHLQAIQGQIDQIFRLSTIFVSVSARISSLESESKVLCLVAGSRVNHTCIMVRRPLRAIGGSPASQRPSGLVWSSVDNIVRGTETPPSWASSLSGKRDQGDRNCVHGKDLIAGKQ